MKQKKHQTTEDCCNSADVLEGCDRGPCDRTGPGAALAKSNAILQHSTSTLHILQNRLLLKKKLRARDKIAVLFKILNQVC